MNSRDKRAVAQSFSRAASSYDGLAQLQRDIGEHLLTLLPASCNGQVLDLGSGTGYFLPSLQARYGRPVNAMDLAGGMVSYARQQHGAQFSYLQGDAENMPIATASISVLYSNLALQWCEDLPRLFTEIRRVLVPGGSAVFSTLLESTLDELRAAWAAVDNYVHVNSFFAESVWRDAVADAGLVIADWRCEPRQMYYARLAELTAELKGIGAHNVNGGRAKGLLAKSDYRALCQAYEKFRDAAGRLPASYRVVFAAVTRED